jgi:hypothetical protein
VLAQRSGVLDAASRHWADHVCKQAVEVDNAKFGLALLHQQPKSCENDHMAL